MGGMRGGASVRSLDRSKELGGDVVARGRRVAGSKIRSYLLKDIYGLHSEDGVRKVESVLKAKTGGNDHWL